MDKKGYRFWDIEVTGDSAEIKLKDSEFDKEIKKLEAQQDKYQKEKDDIKSERDRIVKELDKIEKRLAHVIDENKKQGINEDKIEEVGELKKQRYDLESELEQNSRKDVRIVQSMKKTTYDISETEGQQKIYTINKNTSFKIECQTAHCGRLKPHVDFGTSASPTAQSRGRPQTFSGAAARCRSLA